MYVENREYKIFNLCVFLANHENDVDLYKECLLLLSNVVSKLNANDLESMIWLAKKFNDSLNRVKLENLLKEINNVK